MNGAVQLSRDASERFPHNTNYPLREPDVRIGTSATEIDEIGSQRGMRGVCCVLDRSLGAFFGLDWR
jgi:hypothetical protein